MVRLPNESHIFTLLHKHHTHKAYRPIFQQTICMATNKLINCIKEATLSYTAFKHSYYTGLLGSHIHCQKLVRRFELYILLGKEKINRKSSKSVSSVYKAKLFPLHLICEEIRLHTINCWPMISIGHDRRPLHYNCR